jgi:pyruvate formate lyase activating enzyme
VVDELGPEVPVHFLRYHPDYKWKDLEATKLPTLLKAYQMAIKEGLYFPFIGNIPNEGYEDTRCPDCDTAVIVREGHSVLNNNLKGGNCPECGRKIPVVQ